MYVNSCSSPAAGDKCAKQAGPAGGEAHSAGPVKYVVRPSGRNGGTSGKEPCTMEPATAPPPLSAPADAAPGSAPRVPLEQMAGEGQPAPSGPTRAGWSTWSRWGPNDPDDTEPESETKPGTLSVALSHTDRGTSHTGAGTGARRALCTRRLPGEGKPVGTHRTGPAARPADTTTVLEEAVDDASDAAGGACADWSTAANTSSLRQAKISPTVTSTDVAEESLVALDVVVPLGNDKLGCARRTGMGSRDHTQASWANGDTVSHRDHHFLCFLLLLAVWQHNVAATPGCFAQAAQVGGGAVTVLRTTLHQHGRHRRVYTQTLSSTDPCS